jgi:hypothetical protein
MNEILYQHATVAGWDVLCVVEDVPITFTYPSQPTREQINTSMSELSDRLRLEEIAANIAEIEGA